MRDVSLSGGIHRSGAATKFKAFPVVTTVSLLSSDEVLKSRKGLSGQLSDFGQSPFFPAFHQKSLSLSLFLLLLTQDLSYLVTE